MHELIKKLSEGDERPLSPVDIIRRSLEEAQARKTRPDMPILFDNDALLLFYKNKDQVDGFLATEDAKDILKLLVDSFAGYVEDQEAPEASEVVESESIVEDPKK
jgi:hypothetical protein